MTIQHFVLLITYRLYTNVVVTLANVFFNNSVLPSASCLHYLLPSRRDTDVIAKLRNPNVYCLPTARTERYKHSFLNFALEHFMQHCILMFLVFYLLFYVYCIHVCNPAFLLLYTINHLLLLLFILVLTAPDVVLYHNWSIYYKYF